MNALGSNWLDQGAGSRLFSLPVKRKRIPPYVRVSVVGWGASLLVMLALVAVARGQTAPELEDIFWQEVVCERAREVEAYLQEYPSGTYVAEARACLAAIARRVEAEEALALDSQTIIWVQRGLATLGYPVGVPDGQLGQATRTALWQWQEASGLVATGYVTPAQVDRLTTAGREAAARQVEEEARWQAARAAQQQAQETEVALGLDRRARIRVQQGLMSLDYPVEVADGLFGPVTRLALRNWQRAKGFTATGYLTSEQATTLMEAGRAAADLPPAEAQQLAAAERQRQAAEAERQRQAAAEAERQRQAAEAERARQAEAERQRQAEEAERQRQAAAEAERQRQAAEAERARQAERQRQAEEAERQRQAAAEAERQRQAAEAERQRRAQEMARQREANELVNTIGMEFVRIEAGTFQMGAPARRAGRSGNSSLHTVHISQPFYLGKYEVTQGQWRAVLGDNPSHFTDCGDTCPVENVSWEDAQAFIRELNLREGGQAYRLPTEAEWEYATRAGTRTAYSFGNRQSRLELYGWYRNNAGNTPHPVGSKRPNEWGLYDLHGNVWEWVADWYGDYPSGRVTDPQGPLSGTHRVIRGGGWRYEARDCRSASRGIGMPAFRSGYVGFRLARTP